MQVPARWAAVYDWPEEDLLASQIRIPNGQRARDTLHLQLCNWLVFIWTASIQKSTATRTGASEPLFSGQLKDSRRQLSQGDHQKSACVLTSPYADYLDVVNLVRYKYLHLTFVTA